MESAAPITQSPRRMPRATTRCTRNGNEVEGCRPGLRVAAVSRPAERAALARARQRVSRASATGEPRRAGPPHRRLLAWAAGARGAVVRGWRSTSAGESAGRRQELRGRRCSGGAIRSPAREYLLMGSFFVCSAASNRGPRRHVGTVPAARLFEALHHLGAGLVNHIAPDRHLLRHRSRD